MPITLTGIDAMAALNDANQRAGNAQVRLAAAVTEYKGSVAELTTIRTATGQTVASAIGSSTTSTPATPIPGDSGYAAGVTGLTGAASFAAALAGY